MKNLCRGRNQAFSCSSFQHMIFENDLEKLILIHHLLLVPGQAFYIPFIVELSQPPCDEFLPPIPSGLKVHLAALTSKSEDTHLETAASASRSRSRGV